MVGGVEGHGDSLAAGGGDWEGLKVASNHINYHLETCGGVRNGSVGGNYTVGWIVYTVNFRLLVPSKRKTKLTNRIQAIPKRLYDFNDWSVFCFSVHGTSNLN